MAKIVPPIARRAKRITSGAGLDGMLARSVAIIKKLCRVYIPNFDVKTPSFGLKYSFKCGIAKFHSNFDSNSLSKQ